MFEKILVPVDFSPKNEAALTSAFELAARSEKSEIVLLHVIETIDHLEFDEMAGFYHGLEARAAAKLHQMEERWAGRGVRMRHDVVFGRRAETVVRFAEENVVDLIVLSSHQVDADHPALGWGTISYKIAIVARCPVLLVK